MPAESNLEKSLCEAHRERIAAQLPTLGLVVTGSSLMWIALASFADPGPASSTISPAVELAILLAQASAVGIATLLCRRRPTGRRVAPIAVVTCVLIGLVWVWILTTTGTIAAMVMFAACALFATAPLVLEWGLGPQIAFQASLTFCWIAALGTLPRHLPMSELVSAIAFANLIALMVTQWAARSFRNEILARFAALDFDRQLTASRDAYRGLAENAVDYIWAIDLEGRWTYVNQTLARRCGRTAESMIGQSVHDILIDHPSHADPRDLIARIVAGGEIEPTVWHMAAVDGPCWVEAIATLVYGPGGTIVGIQGSSRDITERRLAEEALRTSEAELRRSEEQLRLLAQRQVAIREEERKRLSFDLHDGVCQELVGIGILLESVLARLDGVGPSIANDLNRSAQYLKEVVAHLRVLARDLQPMLLQDFGLEGSLRALATGLSSDATTVEAVFATAIPRLLETDEVTVYRIAQEAVTNAIRHAEARRVTLTLAAVDTRLQLEVCDDGRGFDVARREATSALGLASMEARAQALSGRLLVESRRGAGSTIRLDCPLHPRSAASAA